MKSKILFLFISIVATINLFAQKAIEFTVKTANVYHFGTFVKRDAKEVDTDLLNVYFKFSKHKKEQFFVNTLPYALTQDFKELDFDSISDLNEKLLLNKKHFDLNKLLNICTSPHVIIESKNGHIYKFIGLPYLSPDKLQLQPDYCTKYYNESTVRILGVDYLTDLFEFDYYFYRKHLPNIGNDSIVRFHIIQGTDTFLKNKGFKPKLFTSNWTKYPSVNNKKFYDNIDTTILGVQSEIYGNKLSDTLNKDNFLALLLLKNSIHFNYSFINYFEPIDSFYSDTLQLYFKTKNHVITRTKILNIDSTNELNENYVMSTQIKCTNDSLIEKVFYGIYFQDSLQKVTERLENFGYTIVDCRLLNYFFLISGDDAIHLKGKNGKLNEVFIEYK